MKTSDPLSLIDTEQWIVFDEDDKANVHILSGENTVVVCSHSSNEPAWLARMYYIVNCIRIARSCNSMLAARRMYYRYRDMMRSQGEERCLFKTEEQPESCYTLRVEPEQCCTRCQDRWKLRDIREVWSTKYQDRMKKLIAMTNSIRRQYHNNYEEAHD